MNIRQIARKYKVKALVEWVDSNPNMPDFNGNHFKVTLKMGGRQMTVPFSQGYGISGEPKAADVLNCLILDAAGYDNAATFSDWCGEYGYDDDSRKAEKIYLAVERQTLKLKKLLGLYYKEFLKAESL